MKLIDLFEARPPIDNISGLGAVGASGNIDYLGLRVQIKPSVFLKLAAPHPDPRSDYIEKHVAAGEPIGAPFLDIHIPEEWFSEESRYDQVIEGDLSMPANIIGHEGRHRMSAILKHYGDEPVETHILLRGLRRRHITNNMITRLNESVISQTGKLFDGPWFDLAMSIAETFDKPYKSKWEKSDYSDVDVLAKLPDGTNLSIMFNHMGDDEWQVEFYRNNSQEVTGEGDAQRIFATVLNAIRKFVKKHKPAVLLFTASKEVGLGQNSQSRAKLYDRLVQRYASAMGYEAYQEDHGVGVVYELTRIEGVTESQEQKISVKDILAYLKKVMGTESHEDWRNNVIDNNEYFVLKNIPLNSLWIDLPMLDKANVEKYKQMDFSKAPPIVIGSDGNIIDGYHRANVAKALGIKSIKAYVGAKGVTENFAESNGMPVTFKIKRRKLNVPALIKAGAIFVTYPHGEQGWETDDKEVWSYSLISLYNVQQGGWTKDARKYLKPESYTQADQDINSSAPNLGTNKLVYDGKYNQILWSIKKLGIADNVAFLDNAQTVTENFADGKGPGKPGDSARHGIPKNATLAQLDSIGRGEGRKAQLARWQANMRRGRKRAAT